MPVKYGIIASPGQLPDDPDALKRIIAAMAQDAIVAQAVAYTQEHGAETIKALGLDPQSGAAVEAIKAHIETAIADPMVPTPKVLDAVPGAKIDDGTLRPSAVQRS